MNREWTAYLPRFIRTQLEKHHTLQKVVTNTGWLFADKILRMAVGFFVIIWVARYLGPEQFGILNYAIAMVALFSAIATLGLDSIVIRDIVRDPSIKEETLGTAFFLKFFGSIFTVFFAVGTIFLIRPDGGVSHWLVGIIAFGMIFQAFDTIDFWFQSQIQSKYTVYAKNTGFLLANLGKIVLILNNAPLIAFAFMALVEIVLGAVGLVLVYQLKGHTLKKWRGNISRGKALLKDSWPLILAGLSVMIYMRIDQVMLAEIAGDREVGIYSAAIQLVGVWNLIPMVITLSLFPVIVESKNLKESIYQARMQKLYDLMVWLAIAVAVVTSFFSYDIIQILYGLEYQGAGAVLSIQAWIATSVFFNVARNKWLISEGFVKHNLFINITGVLLNVPGNLILIPLYGAVGASVASLITAFGANFIVAIYSKPIRDSLRMYGRSLFLPARIFRENVY